MTTILMKLIASDCSLMDYSLLRWWWLTSAYFSSSTFSWGTCLSKSQSRGDFSSKSIDKVRRVVWGYGKFSSCFLNVSVWFMVLDTEIELPPQHHWLVKLIRSITWDIKQETNEIMDSNDSNVNRRRRRPVFCSLVNLITSHRYQAYRSINRN